MGDPELTQRMIEYTGRLLGARGYSRRTRTTYLHWIGRFMRRLGHPHPRAIGRRDVERFLEHLANEGRLAPKTRNQAASALAFLFREVLGTDALAELKRARECARPPTVLSHGEVTGILDQLSGRKRVAAALMYGTGTRLSETLGLRIRDLDFELGRITVREAKGGASRVVMLPDTLRGDLRRLVATVKRRHEADRKRGTGWAALPSALDRKRPEAGYELGWQFLFQARKLSKDPATNRSGRYHLDPTAVQRAFKTAVKDANIHKPATCHTLRHSFATQMLRDGYDIRIVQELLGHKDVRTTMIYLHVVDQVGFQVRSPLDRDRPNRPGTD